MLNLTAVEIAAITSAFADDEAHFGTPYTEGLSVAVLAGAELTTFQLDDLDGVVNRQMERMDEEVVRHEPDAYKALLSMYDKIQAELDRLWTIRDREARNA